MLSSDKPRQVVVLREGPPAHRTAIVDGIVGVAGVALLVFAGVLGEVLPEEDIVPVQYQTAYPLNSTQAAIRYVEDGGEEHFSNGGLIFNGVADNPPMPMEGDTFDIDIFVERDNVIAFKVRIVMSNGVAPKNSDDLPSSLQDNFKFQLYNPEGEPIEDFWRVMTEPAVRHEPDPEDPENATIIYTSPPISESKIVRFRAQPEAEFIGSNRTDFTKTEAQLVASERYTIPTKGTVWTLRMTMSNAGDCEPASPDPAVLQRRAHCLSQTDGAGEDPGNPVTVSEISYDYYLIEIQE